MASLATAPRFYWLWGRYPGVTPIPWVAPIGFTHGCVLATPTAFYPIFHALQYANVRIDPRERSHQHTRTLTSSCVNARIDLRERSNRRTQTLALTYANIRIATHKRSDHPHRRTHEPCVPTF